MISPSLQNRSANLLGFATSFEFGVVRVLTDVSKERSRRRGQKDLVGRDRSV